MANVDDTRIKFTSLDAVKSGLGLEPAAKRLQLRVQASDLDAAATTDTVDFASQLPANSILWGISYKLDEKFDAPDATDFTVQLGDGSDADRFMSAVDIHDSGTLGFARVNPADPGGAADVYPLALASATTLRATFTLTSDNAEDTTVGDITIWAHYFAPEDPTGV